MSNHKSFWFTQRGSAEPIGLVISDGRVYIGKALGSTLATMEEDEARVIENGADISQFCLEFIIFQAQEDIKKKSGATRSSSEDKIDVEAAMSPRVMLRYAEYMLDNRKQPDGSMRPDDNWQKGIPIPRYMKGLSRHTLDVQLIHRGHKGKYTDNLQEALCGIFFNTIGLLFEDLRRTDGMVDREK